MEQGFPHLHVASSFSLRYGASSPVELVKRAVELGQSTLALTDRDGTYGAVRFVQACEQANIAPVLGVDLVYATAAAQSAVLQRPVRSKVVPAKGGVAVDDRRPRVTVLARGQQSGLEPGQGWGRLCRLVSQAHLRGQRGNPSASLDILRRAAAPIDHISPVIIVLGPDSDFGRAVLAGHRQEAAALLRRWQRCLPAGALRVEIVCHGGPAGTPGNVTQAARMWSMARQLRVPVALTAMVRHAEVPQSRVVDVLDAARRMVPLDERHLDRVTTAGHLASTGDMTAIAHRVAAASGADARASDLLSQTSALAHECRLEGHSDLGIGSVHLPEPEVLGATGIGHAQHILSQRCHDALSVRYPGQKQRAEHAAVARLQDELGVIAGLGYGTYFLTVAAVCDLMKDNGVRVAARGSGAGSLVTYLLGISGVDPLRHDLLMERFCTPLRAQLPDIDVDVESARRTEMYEKILEKFGSDRVTCVSMMETYRVRHAIRDVAATLGMPPGEIDVIAKAFPHIRAKDARSAINDLPELRRMGFDGPRMQMLFELVESLDGLPRHVALHPCGIILSNTGLLDRTPVESSWLGFPMSQFDKDDVEDLGLLKLDVLGIRMQSAMSHAIDEVKRVDGLSVDLDDEAQVPFDDPATFSLIQSTRTLGCFQIESPGQRELIGKFGPSTFEDIIIDIALFRPGPVKSDMIRPFLNARQGWSEPEYLHESLIPALQSTCGVVVFHEQVLRIVAQTTGATLAQADEVRRAMGTPKGQIQVEKWWRQAAADRGYTSVEIDRIWEVLAAFASFGFCKAHAAAFALPTYQSAWLKTHHTAAFLAGVLSHDPGMYPKRLILDEARTMGVQILGLDVNSSRAEFTVERFSEDAASVSDSEPCESEDRVDRDMAIIHKRAARYGIRLSLAEVKGINEAEVARVVAGQPFQSLGDFWRRGQVSRPVVERLILAGAFDELYGVGACASRGSGLSRRDLLLQLAELERWSRGQQRKRPHSRGARGYLRDSTSTHSTAGGEVAVLARGQAQGQRPGRSSEVVSAQLTLDIGDEHISSDTSGLPEMTSAEQTLAELEVLGMDVTSHVVTTYWPMLKELGVTPADQLLRHRQGAEVFVAGAKVATQTPPIRSGRRVVFLTVDDGTGPSDSTFFEDAQGEYASTVFHSWLLVVRGVLRRTGARGRSVRANGAWDMTQLAHVYETEGIEAVRSLIDAPPTLDQSLAESAATTRRVLLHPSGFKQSPYADTRPPGAGTHQQMSKLWHSSPGSLG